MSVFYLTAWDGGMVKKKKSKYDKAVRCSHTAPHSPVVTHNHANVTVAELQPADRTGLRRASAAAAAASWLPR